MDTKINVFGNNFPYICMIVQCRLYDVIVKHLLIHSQNNEIFRQIGIVSNVMLENF